MVRYFFGPLVAALFGYFCAMELDKGGGWLQIFAFAAVAGSVCFIVPFVVSGVRHIAAFYGYALVGGELVWVAVSMVQGA
ncbi:MAG TPA: hypothetical protein VJ843_05510 [Candidatus Saccharimonadales bacterium]|nr:hypothetical protein [Candidatus Saccharimonadales bacterium]